MLFDTHAHLEDEKFDDDRAEVIENIKNAGIGFVVNPGCDVESSKKAVKLSEEYDFIYAAVGVHPHDTEDMTPGTLDEIEKLCSHKKVKAVGEIGLDYYYDFSAKEKQIYWFEEQMELAKKVKLPVIIHDRDAHRDTIDILKKKHVEEVGGVMHCFSGSVEMAEEALRLGMYISVAGPVTFKNSARLPQVVLRVPNDRLLIETDSPYLTPEPMRGKRNDSSKIIYTAKKIAEIKNISMDELMEITTANARRFFNI